jgi:DNA-binding CsgD family transcriptional regulator
VSDRGWDGVAPELREIIERVCTPRQIDALKLVNAGAGARRIGLALGIDESAARGLLARARRRIQAEVAAQRGVQ